MKHLVHISPLTESDRALVDDYFLSHSKVLETYADLLLWWNSKVNLLSRNVSRETIVEHIRHSLWVLKSDWVNNARTVLDTGTGGGLPGIPVALTRTGLEMVLNDIVQKKGMVLKDLLPKLELTERVRVQIKDVAEINLNPDVVITKHAFKIGDLLHRVDKETCSRFVFLKGYTEVEKEIKQVEEVLSVRVYKLDEINTNPFYEGKGLVEIERIGEVAK
ncbi:MAG: RsmG family class I SAM-dependent methyltransferase [Bacteroidota bacterium]